MKNFAFWLAAAVAFIGPTTGVLLGNSEAGWASLISALVLMLATRFDAVEEFSFGPLKAKLREKIEEVEKFLVPLRALALSLSEQILTLTMGEGRWGGMGYEEKFKVREEIERLLDNLKISGDQRSNIYRRWNKYLEFDHAHKIGSNRTNKLPTEFIAQINALHAEAHKGGKVSSASEYRKLFSDAGRMTDEIEEQIKDLEHFQAKQTFRRQEIWFKRGA